MKCDRCLEREAVMPFPFRYKDASDSRSDQDGYFQPFGCRECVGWEVRFSFNKRLKKWGFRKLPLKPLVPWLRFSKDVVFVHSVFVRDNRWG